jgi:hypothetical protein
MLHFSTIHLVNMNAPVHTFTNELRKNISDKGGACYEENISMARGKPQQMKMTAEIKSTLKYAI